MVYGILSTICPFQGAAARYPSVSRTRAANWRNKARESKKSRALPRFGLLFHGSSGLPAGPIVVNHPPFLSNTEPCFAARARQSCATFDGCARYLGPFIIISLNAE
jgi:hypothetical protein